MKHSILPIIISLFALVSLIPAVPAAVSAQSGNLMSADELLDSAAVGTGVESGELSTLPGAIALALRFVLSLLGTLMFGYMVYAGYLWMTAQGDEGAISTAKGIMVNTVIGFLVVVSAWAITYLVQSRFR